MRGRRVTLIHSGQNPKRRLRPVMPVPPLRNPSPVRLPRWMDTRRVPRTGETSNAASPTPTPFQQIDGKEIRAARHPKPTIVRHSHMVGRNRFHRVPTKQRSNTQWRRWLAQSHVVHRRYSPITRTSEPEKTVPTYAGFSRWQQRKISEHRGACGSGHSNPGLRRSAPRLLPSSIARLGSFAPLTGYALTDAPPIRRHEYTRSRIQTVGCVAQVAGTSSPDQPSSEESLASLVRPAWAYDKESEADNDEV